MRRAYLKGDGVPLDLRHVFEYIVDNPKKLVALQKDGLILLKIVDEVVKDEVRPCNNENKTEAFSEHPVC